MPKISNSMQFYIIWGTAFYHSLLQITVLYLCWQTHQEPEFFMQIIVKNKKWQYSTVDGKADFDNLPCTTREPNTVFFYLFCNLSRKDKEITQNTDKMEMDSILCSENEAESVEMLNTLILNTKLSFMVWFSFLSSYLKCSSHDVHSLNYRRKC